MTNGLEGKEGACPSVREIPGRPAIATPVLAGNHGETGDESIPAKLSEQLLLWRHRSPWRPDAEAVDELFPTASYQYILYGMGFRTEPLRTCSHQQDQRQRQAAEFFQQNAARASQLQQAMPSNRELLNKVREFGFQKL